jgi:RNA-directed DNA polymerase
VRGTPSGETRNVVLNAFDREMNDPARGLICIRYIDDFIILGKKLKSVEKGMQAAKRKLQALRMDVYEPDSSGQKAFIGQLDGTQDFLGYCLAPGRYPPSRSAQSRFRVAIDRLVRDGQIAIEKALSGRPLKPTDRTFASTIVAITKTSQGWRGAFQCSHCPETFKELDHWVQGRVGDLQGYLNRKSHDKPATLKGMALGVMPLVAPSKD